MTKVTLHDWRLTNLQAIPEESPEQSARQVLLRGSRCRLAGFREAALKDRRAAQSSGQSSKDDFEENWTVQALGTRRRCSRTWSLSPSGSPPMRRGAAARW